MKCTCHPGPYRKPECPCQAAYLAHREAELERDTTTPEEAERHAEELVAAGYVQASRKYRMVAIDDADPLTLGIRTFEAFRRRQ